MDVMIALTGVQHADGDTDTVQLITAGTMTISPEGYSLCYAETAATGMAGTETTLWVQPRKVTLERRGTHAGLLVLEHKKRHVGSYGTPYGELMLGVFTDVMEQKLDDNGGTLDVSYTLDIGGSMLSRQDLHVAVTPQTEIDRKEVKA